MSEHKIVSPVAEDIKAHMKRGKIVSADEAVRLIRAATRLPWTASWEEAPPKS